MRHTLKRGSWAILAVLALAACSSTTPKGRELAAATAIRTVDQSATAALDFGIITPDQGEKVLALRDAAEAALRRAVAARRAQNKEAWEVALDSMEAALSAAQAALTGKEGETE